MELKSSVAGEFRMVATMRMVGLVGRTTNSSNY